MYYMSFSFCLILISLTTSFAHSTQDEGSRVADTEVLLGKMDHMYKLCAWSLSHCNMTDGSNVQPGQAALLQLINTDVNIHSCTCNKDRYLEEKIDEQGHEGNTYFWQEIDNVPPKTSHQFLEDAHIGQFILFVNQLSYNLTARFTCRTILGAKPYKPFNYAVCMFHSGPLQDKINLRKLISNLSSIIDEIKYPEDECGAIYGFECNCKSGHRLSGLFNLEAAIKCNPYNDCTCLSQSKSSFSFFSPSSSYEHFKKIILASEYSSEVKFVELEVTNNFGWVKNFNITNQELICS